MAFVTGEISHYSTARNFHNLLNSVTDNVMTEPRVIQHAPRQNERVSLLSGQQGTPDVGGVQAKVQAFLFV